MIFHKSQENFKSLYSTQAGAVQRFIQGMIKNDSVAQELTQESFLKAWKALPQFSFKSSLKTWVYSIAINTTRDWLRSHRHTIPWNEALATIDGTETNESRAVQESLWQLDEETRALLLLHYYDDFSQKEIGALLKIPEGTVKSRLFKAKSELKKILIQQGFDV